MSQAAGEGAADSMSGVSSRNEQQEQPQPRIQHRWPDQILKVSYMYIKLYVDL